MANSEGRTNQSRFGAAQREEKAEPGAAILQLLLNALHGDASRQSVGIGEILRPDATPPESSDIQQRIRRAFFEIAGNPPHDSVRLSALRASLHDATTLWAKCRSRHGQGRRNLGACKRRDMNCRFSRLSPAHQYPSNVERSDYTNNSGLSHWRRGGRHCRGPPIAGR